MSQDASAAAASPMTNGTYPSGSHREADASSSAATTTLADVCADLNQRITNFLAADPENEVIARTQEQTRITVGVIEKALQDYDFDALSLSYNGGKDCLVLLVIYLAVLHTHSSQPIGRRKAGDNDLTFPTSIPSVYAKPPDPFPSVTSFVESSTADYHLSLEHISTNPGPKSKSHSDPPTNPTDDQIPASTASSSKIVSFRDAFALYLSSHPSVRAIFVGTRRSDPHGAHLTHFDMTDGSWPRFMRIHPVIDWHLSEIWAFLRSPYLATAEDREARGKDAHVPYCGMYDEGYTSLGGVGDTLRNPNLRYLDEQGVEKYRPAWMLTEDDEERLGRE